MTVTVAPNLHQMLTRRGGAVDQGMYRKALQVHARAVAGSPVDTGRMAASIHVQASTTPGGWNVVVPVDYFRWVHDGTKRMRGRPFLVRALQSVIGGG